mmetsp:Transcript_66813/g.186485  ORF Transcript_66813/g.186485 Transcript_66813/m.186485 type:complete len:225 (-) Transcript_66813:385-1059(-)
MKASEFFQHISPHEVHHSPGFHSSAEADIVFFGGGGDCSGNTMPCVDNVVDSDDCKSSASTQASEPSKLPPTAPHKGKDSFTACVSLAATATSIKAVTCTSGSKASKRNRRRASRDMTRDCGAAGVSAAVGDDANAASSGWLRLHDLQTSKSHALQPHMAVPPGTSKPHAPQTDGRSVTKCFNPWPAEHRKDASLFSRFFRLRDEADSCCAWCCGCCWGCCCCC